MEDPSDTPILDRLWRNGALVNGLSRATYFMRECSADALAKALYSASVDDRETGFCRVDSHEMMLVPRIMHELREFVDVKGYVRASKGEVSELLQRKFVAQSVDKVVKELWIIAHEDNIININHKEPIDILVFTDEEGRIGQRLLKPKPEKEVGEEVVVVMLVEEGSIEGSMFWVEVDIGVLEKLGVEDWCTGVYVEHMFDKINMKRMVKTIGDGIIALVCGFGRGVSKEDALD
ncbi:hypothetical protein Tco_0913981 [Tanacetum coccineum]